MDNKNKDYLEQLDYLEKEYQLALSLEMYSTIDEMISFSLNWHAEEYKMEDMNASSIRDFVNEKMKKELSPKQEEYKNSMYDIFNGYGKNMKLSHLMMEISNQLEYKRITEGGDNWYRLSISDVELAEVLITFLNELLVKQELEGKRK